MNKFYRIEKDEIAAGVCTGLAEYFDFDVTLVRVIFFISFFITGFSLLVYLAIAVAAPKRYENTPSTYEQGFEDGMLAGREIEKENKDG